MKIYSNLLRISAILCLLGSSLSFKNPVSFMVTPFNGAWQLQGVDYQEIAIFSNGYFMTSRYDKANKKLLRTLGGTYDVSNNQLNLVQEFNSEDISGIGQPFSLGINFQGDKLSVDVGGEQQSWQKLDNGTGPLAGVWRSGGRLQDGKVSFNPLGARKTFKIMSGTRFQWTAMNTETKEFLGSGGGSYTYVNGKYTEHIEFFSRDSSRVGMSLSFNDKIENDNWHHSGLTSKGAQMNEIWGRVEL